MARWSSASCRGRGPSAASRGAAPYTPHRSCLLALAADARARQSEMWGRAGTPCPCCLRGATVGMPRRLCRRDAALPGRWPHRADGARLLRTLAAAVPCRPAAVARCHEEEPRRLARIGREFLSARHLPGEQPWSGVSSASGRLLPRCFSCRDLGYNSWTEIEPMNWI